MKYQQILENLCYHDERNPEKYRIITSTYEDGNCCCPNCTSGKTKLALVMLDMVCCFNCRGWCKTSNETIKCKTRNFNKWELSK